jgi:hypothetical protein
VNTIVKDAARIKEHVNFIFHLIHVYLSLNTVLYCWYMFVM